MIELLKIKMYKLKEENQWHIEIDQQTMSRHNGLFKIHKITIKVFIYTSQILELSLNLFSLYCCAFYQQILFFRFSSFFMALMPSSSPFLFSFFTWQWMLAFLFGIFWFVIVICVWRMPCKLYQKSTTDRKLSNQHDLIDTIKIANSLTNSFFNFINETNEIKINLGIILNSDGFWILQHYNTNHENSVRSIYSVEVGFKL